jgi:hypothetical protein
MYPIRITHRLNHDVLGRSALPDAPVVPARESRVERVAVPLRGTRLSLARGLRAVARAVEPAPRCTPEARF